MPGYFTYDSETSIQYDEVQVPLKGKKNKGRFKTVRKESLHGASWKDPKNDIYSIIYGGHPDKINMLHSKKGFKRKLPFRVGKALLKSHTMIGTNLKFDLGYIWHDKYFQKWLKNGGKIWDCQIAAYLLGGQRWQYPSLGEMQAVILGRKTKLDSITKLFKRMIGANEIIARRNERKFWFKAYQHYGNEDGRSPMLIMQKQYKEAKAKGMLSIIELYNQYLLALTMMEVNGIPVDIPAVEKLYQEFSLEVVKYLEKATAIVKQFWTDPDLPALNINSPAQSSLLLFGGDIKVKRKVATGTFIKSGKNKGKEKIKTVEELVHINGFGLNGETFSRETATKGRYSTDKGVIENIYDRCKDENVIEYCKNLKLSATYKQKISTYLNAMLFKSVDGIIRANYNNTETRTSRLSASSPNLQNIPAHGEFGASIPALLIAPKGWTCCSIDFSQLEVLCQAMLSRDWNLCRDIREGVDFHVKRLCYVEPEYTYEQICQLAKVLKEGDWPEKRSKAKVISFQKAYGAAPESLAKITELPLELVKQIFEKEDIEYPQVKEFDDKLAKEVQQSAILSRKYHYAAKSVRGKDSKGVPRKFSGNVELLPIRERDRKTYTFVANEYRHVGFYVSPTGKRYSFLEYGSRKKDGEIFRYYKPTQMKNYAMQGSAGDIQAITTVAMFDLLLKHPDKVKLVNEIHDSKWFLIKNEYLSRIVPKLCGIMKSTTQLLQKRFDIKIDFDFDVEAKCGPNFADMEVYKEQAA